MPKTAPTTQACSGSFHGGSRAEHSLWSRGHVLFQGLGRLHIPGAAGRYLLGRAPAAHFTLVLESQAILHSSALSHGSGPHGLEKLSARRLVNTEDGGAQQFDSTGRPRAWPHRFAAGLDHDNGTARCSSQTRPARPRQSGPLHHQPSRLISRTFCARQPPKPPRNLAWPP